jgi:cyclase
MTGDRSMGPMQIVEIAHDVLMATGGAYASNAVAFVHGREVLLVDALGSRTDAVALREALHARGLTVTLVIASHYFSDHMAALAVLPEARVIAHRGHADTFAREQFRSPEEAGFWRPVDIAVDGGFEVRFGLHVLDVLHVPGHTPSTLAVDVRGHDLLLASDTAVGHIVYLKYGDEAALRRSLDRLIALGRSRVVLGHGGVQPRGVLEDARHYLDRLQALVGNGREPKGIGLDECLAPGLAGTDWEAMYHARNLDVVAERGRFTVPA